MPMPDAVTWSTLPMIGFWSLVVWLLAFIATSLAHFAWNELTVRRARDPDEVARMHEAERLRWELQNRKAWQGATNDRGLTKAQPLSEPELAERSARLAQLSQGSLPGRVLHKLLYQCAVCRHTWVAIAVVLFLGKPTGVGDAVAAIAGYAALATAADLALLRLGRGEGGGCQGQGQQQPRRAAPPRTARRS